MAALRLGWCALIVLLVQKGWSNLLTSWKDNPLSIPTAFGVIAGNEDTVKTLAGLHHLLGDSEKPAHLFAYPTDAWLYLTLPADNPTPFCLLRPRYNTSDQFQRAIESLNRDRAARILVAQIVVRADDPLMEFVKHHYRELEEFGPRIVLGAPIYVLYERDDTPNQ